jgi:hypothetical protein
VLVGPLRDQQVGEVDADRPDLDEGIVGTGDGLGDIGRAQCAGAVVGLELEGAHGRSIGASVVLDHECPSSA